MVTQAEVAAITKRAREASARIVVTFKGLRYAMVINGFIKAEDRDSSKVEWSKAFGSLTPKELLSSMPIEKIEVQLPNKTFIFNQVKELLKWAL